MRTANALSLLLAIAGLVWGLKLGTGGAVTPPPGEQGELPIIAMGPWIPADKEAVIQKTVSLSERQCERGSSPWGPFFCRGGTLLDLVAAARGLSGAQSAEHHTVRVAHLLGTLRRCGAERVTWQVRREIGRDHSVLECEYQGKPDLPWRIHDRLLRSADDLALYPQEVHWLTLEAPHPGAEPIVLGRLRLRLGDCAADR